MDIDVIEIGPSLRAAPVAPVHARALASLVDHNLAHLHPYLPAVTALAAFDVAEAYLGRAAARAQDDDVLEWHIFSDGALCGALRLNHIETDNRKASVAYYVGADYQGRGIASSAVRALLRYAFRVLDMNRVELRCVPANLPSVRMAERLGFTREGVLRQAELLDGVFMDHAVYGLLRADFVRMENAAAQAAVVPG